MLRKDSPLYLDSIVNSAILVILRQTYVDKPDNVAVMRLGVKTSALAALGLSLKKRVPVIRSFNEKAYGLNH